jgi:hypothetical protein
MASQEGQGKVTVSNLVKLHSDAKFLPLQAKIEQNFGKGLQNSMYLQW